MNLLVKSINIRAVNRFKEYSRTMFPLRCARRVRAHTGREMSAHKKTWRAHKCSFQKWFCTFHTRHSKFRWLQVQCCTKEILLLN